jgi:hypothetical protein
MATDFIARNRTYVRSEKIVGTKIESLPDFSHEFIGGSEGYGAGENSESDCIDETSPDFHHLRLRANQHGSALCDLLKLI